MSAVHAAPWREPDDARRWPAAAALALVVEAALIGGVLWYARHAPEPPPPPPMQIVLEAPRPAPKTVAPPAPKPIPKPIPKPMPKPQPKPLPKPVMHHVAPRPVVPPPLPTPKVVAPPAPVPDTHPAMPVAAPAAMAVNVIVTVLNVVFALFLMIGWLIVAIQGPHLLKQWSYRTGFAGGVMHVGGYMAPRIVQTKLGGTRIGGYLGLSK
jgi:hypothetical protein